MHKMFTIKSTYLETLLYTELFLYHYIFHIDLENFQQKTESEKKPPTSPLRCYVHFSLWCYDKYHMLLFLSYVNSSLKFYIITEHNIFFISLSQYCHTKTKRLKKKSLYTQEYFHWQLYICGKSSHYLLLFINISAIFIRILDNRVPCITLSSSIMEGSKESFNSLLPGKSR